MAITLTNATKTQLLGAMGDPASTQNLLDYITQQGSGDIKSDGSVPFSANQSLGGNKLTNLSDPVSNQDAATKAYVLANAGSGTVTNVSASGNIASSGGATPNITFTGTLPIASGGTNNGSLSVGLGKIVYSNASQLLTLNAGTSGQVLQSNGGAAPSWVTPGGFSDVSARAYHIPGGANIGNSLGIVKFDTVQYGGTWYNTNGNDYSYIAPNAGKYKVNASILVAGSLPGDIVVIEIWLNGVAASSNSFYLDPTNLRAQAVIFDTIRCSVSDVITIMASCSSTSPGIVSSNTKNVLSIDRIA